MTDKSTTTALKREIRFEPGYDCMRFECANGSSRCFPGSGGSHGVHGLNIRWLVIGKKGVVQFLLCTGWLPEPAPFGERDFGKSHLAPNPADLGYHSKEQMYEGQESMECEFLGKCYYDGSGLNAEEPFRVLCNEGGEALWQYLEAVYRSRFHEEPWPETKPYKFAPRVPVPHD